MSKSKLKTKFHELKKLDYVFFRNTQIEESQPHIDTTDLNAHIDIKRVEDSNKFLIENYSTFAKSSSNRGFISRIKNEVLSKLNKYVQGQVNYNSYLAQSIVDIWNFQRSRYNDINIQLSKLNHKIEVFNDNTSTELTAQIADIASKYIDTLKTKDKLVTSVNNLQKEMRIVLNNIEEQNKTITAQQSDLSIQQEQLSKSKDIISELEVENKRLSKLITYFVHENNAINNAHAEKHYIYDLKNSGAKYKPTGRYFSQFGEDRWILENLDIPKTGYFLDIGASDGITYSNTYYFERLGWEGVCFEPDPRNYNIAKLYRGNVLNKAVAEKEGKLNFKLSAQSPDLSGLEIEDNIMDSLQVDAVNINNFLHSENIKHVNLLSVDTEGTELKILQTINFDEITFDIIIAEYISSGRETKGIIEFMESKDYELKLKTESNYIFLKKK